MDLSSSINDVQDWRTMIGLPADPSPTTPPPGLDHTEAGNIAAPLITTAQSIWDTIKQDSISAVNAVETGVKNVYGGIKDVTKTVYTDVKSGVGTVADDVTHPVAEATKTTYWYLLLGIIVVAGGLYFVGKSGAVRVSV